MHFEIKRNAKTNEVTLVGDDAFFFWLTTAAGNARSGRSGNGCQVTEGKGAVLLEPLKPIPDAPDAAKRSIAEVAVTHSSRKSKPKS
jgi:hypothetical protein